MPEDTKDRSSPLLLSVVSAAVTAANRGYTCIPIKAQSKSPAVVGWTKLKFETSEEVKEQFTQWYEEGHTNVGVLLGERSSNLVDVDLDHPTTHRLKGHFLPPTDMVTGRPGNAASHYWYKCKPDTTPTTRRHKMPDGEVSVELRSSGGQTVIPPSIHPSGEAYRWEFKDWGYPGEVDGHYLTTQVALLALGTVLIDAWPTQGGRHEAYLALAGGMLRNSDGSVHPFWERNLPVLISALADATHDDDGADNRVKEVMDSTLRRIRTGDTVQGFGKLSEILGDDTVRQARALAREVEPAAGDDSSTAATVKVIDSKPLALDVVSADQVTMRRVRYLWHGRIPLGAVTVAPGEEGIGKSTVLGALVVSDLTNGELPGEFYGQPQDVVIVAPEDGLADVLVPRLCAAGADLQRVHIVRSVTVEDQTVPVELPRDLKVIHGLVSKVSAGLVLIDSLVTTFAAEVNTTKYKDTASVLRRLGEWAEEAGVAVLAPWHLNKREGTNTAARMMDSRAFRTAVRSVLLMVEDPEAPPGVTGGILALDKANAGTLNVPGLRYVIESAQVEVSDDEAEGGTAVTEVGRARWTGEVDGTTARDTARSALEPAVKREGPTAAQWLTAYLAEHGETARAEVLKAAEAGPGQYSASAIKNAASALGVVSREVKGYKDGRPYRAAFWRLKDDATASASTTGGQDEGGKDQR